MIGEQVLNDNDISVRSSTEEPTNLGDLMFTCRTNKMIEILEENFASSQQDSL